MPPTLEEVVYDLARAALDEQRDLVANMRSRAAPVLAGTGALAALLARPAIDDGLSFSDHRLHAVLVCVGIVGSVVALIGAILVLATRDFGFSVDIDQLYGAAYADREKPDVYLARIAESHRQRRVDNRDGVRWLQRCLAGGLVGVVLEVVGFATAVAVHLSAMASPPQNNPKPTPAQPPKPKPYPNIFFVEGKSLGNSHGKTRG
jgi:hypothetical protein